MSRAQTKRKTIMSVANNIIVRAVILGHGARAIMEALTFLKAVVMAVIVPVLLVAGGTLLMILEEVLLLILAIQRCNASRNLQKRWHRSHHKLA
jgi:hypothetical protein